MPLLFKANAFFFCKKVIGVNGPLLYTCHVKNEEEKRIAKHSRVGFIIALLLTCAGGFLEAYSLYYRGFWGMMMTGNLVYGVAGIVEGTPIKLLTYIPVVILFTVGVFLARLIEDKIAKNNEKKYHIIELSVIVGLLLVVMAIPTIFDPETKNPDKFAWPNIISNGLIAIIGGFLTKSFASFDEVPYTATMMTANMGRLAISTYDAIFGEEKAKSGKAALKYLVIILLFAASAIGCYCFYYFVYKHLDGEALVSYFPNLTLVIPLILISSALAVSIQKKE